MIFNDKTIVITGGTRGIGHELCMKFAKAGCNVAFCYRNSKDKAINLTKEITEVGGKSLSFQCDVSDYLMVSNMMKKIYEHFRSIDILINNAGILKVGMLAGMKQNDWKDLIETNLNGLFNCTKTALPYLMKKKNGVIINFSSFMAFRPVGQAQAVYAATKAGVIGFTRSLSKEISQFGVRVNAISPGLIDTEMIKPLGEKVINDILFKTNLKRLGTKEEVCNAALFLASDEAKYISGQVIIVDGGGVSYQF